MPIDDIPYLLQNSVKENLIVLIDSSARDKSVWPTPGEFVINFHEPFSLVFGIDIIHASIPRTMFMIDEHCNKIVFYSGWNSIIETRTTYHSHMIPRNYETSDNLFDDIRHSLNNAINNIDNNNIDITFLVSIDDNNVPKIKNRPIMKVETTQPFIFDMDASSAYEIIGFNMLTNSREMFEYKRYIPLSHILKSNERFDLNTLRTRYYDPFTVHLDLQLQYTDTHSYVIFELHSHLIYDLPYYIKNIQVFHQNKKLHFSHSNIHVLSFIDDFFDPNDIELSPTTKIKIDIYLESYDKHQVDTVNMRIEYNYFSNYHGKYNNIHKMFCSIDENIYLEDTDVSDLSTFQDKKIMIFTFEWNTTKKLKDNQSYWFYYSDDKNNDTHYFKCVYNDNNNTFSFRSYLDETTIVNPFNLLIFPLDFKLYFIDEDITNAIRIVYIKYLQIDEYTLLSYSITAPGLINLVSDNYIILKCDNIESQIQGSYLANHQSPGLGIFDINFEGYNMKNTSFIPIDYKEFHPIGKLSKLHFRFERRNSGEIYDFKGVDLSFILSIKFYRPKSKYVFDEYSLNPNYTANFIDYMNNFNNSQIKHKNDVYTDDEDDDDEDDDDETNTTSSSDHESLS